MTVNATAGARAAPAPSAPAPSRYIVPVKGLWVVGGALVLLIVSVVGNWRWALDFLHVSSGALWTSIDLFMGFVIGPILGRLDPPARVSLTRRLMPQLMLLMPTVVLLTLVSGWQLARNLGLLQVPYPQHWWLVASFIVVGVLAIIAYAVLEPANIIVLLELRKPQPNVHLIRRVMRRFIYTSGVMGAMQLAILIIMTRIATW